jgi:hypothetical protein
MIDAASCFNVTVHPTVAWTAPQLREAFSFDQLRACCDRDAIFGNDFREHHRYERRAG